MSGRFEVKVMLLELSVMAPVPLVTSTAFPDVVAEAELLSLVLGPRTLMPLLSAPYSFPPLP